MQITSQACSSAHFIRRVVWSQGIPDGCSGGPGTHLQALPATQPSYALIILSLDLHLSRTVQHSLFCVWSFASCSRGLSILQYICFIPFFLGQHSAVWTLHTKFVHTQTDEHLGHFQLLAALNVSPCIDVYFPSSFPGHMVSHCHS